MVRADILLDSISKNGVRLVTFELEFPRYILPQVLTHRVFSRNTSSSRAIPVKRMIAKVVRNPAIPSVFYRNKKGMQSHNVHSLQWAVLSLYMVAMWVAIAVAWVMSALKVHKQHVNRIIEPFSHTTMVLSGTDFDNFFKLRISKDAQHEIHDLAVTMKTAMDNSIPSVRKDGIHAPYSPDNIEGMLTEKEVILVSVARCARVSYRSNTTMKFSTTKEDVDLAEMLLKDGHLSPFEHIAIDNENGATANFSGWTQWRTAVENNWEYMFTG